MSLPEGRLHDRQVVTDLGEPLADALESTVTGYLRIESDGLLLDRGGATVLTFEAGVPVAATHTEHDSTGADALADAAVEGLYRYELRELPAEALPGFHHSDRASIPPVLPAEQLVGDSDLVARTRNAAPESRLRETTGGEPGLAAVESFLEDTDAISTIRDRARSEAHERADQWGFETVESDDTDGTDR
ncbi:MAG: hypothetical protein J07HX64_02380 [halophilic archaeon J07HX64]|jgi:hypothetical protein|nr:MAG: hypothetical protein J07HX64_02380 [halophilic archaeon J07HX64]